MTPTAEEVAEHEAAPASHVTRRTWCGHCMRARGLHERRSPKDPREKDARGLPIISLDYFWMVSCPRYRRRMSLLDSLGPMPAKGADAYGSTSSSREWLSKENPEIRQRTGNEGIVRCNQEGPQRGTKRQAKAMKSSLAWGPGQ